MSMGPARKRHSSILYGFMSVRVDQSRIRLFFSHARKKTDCARSLPRPEIGSANKMRPVARAGERRADRATSESKYIYISHSGTRHIPS